MKTNTQIGSTNINGEETVIFNGKGEVVFIDANTEVIQITNPLGSYAEYETITDNIRLITLKKNISL